MKSFLKGVLLGVMLIFTNRFCSFFLCDTSGDVMEFAVAAVFFVVATLFLVSENIPELLLCGFSGMFVMFFGEIFIFQFNAGSNWLEVYVSGFLGSMAALALSVILTLKKVNIYRFLKKDGGIMENRINKDLKLKLLLYSIISAISFTYFVTPENAAVSVLLFVCIQFICLWFIVPNRKKLWWFVPIFIMSFNCLWSASEVWRVTNFIVALAMYCCMFTDIDLKKDYFGYFSDVITNIVMPFAYFDLPLKWTLDLNSKKAPVIKRIVIALAAAIPCSILLILLLSSADMVFSLKSEMLLEDILNIISVHNIFLIICGITAGLYLCGCVYNSYSKKATVYEIKPNRMGDMIIINILLSAVLFIYTLFVVIQFKYLFAGSQLPEGLSYTEYARKGFFELLALSCINIAAILTVVRLTKNHTGKWHTFSRILCLYLCTITVVLLVSSFYKMMLYTNDDGLTRLRFFVMGFLVFELFGLVATYFYIVKPKFNITAIYFAIALAYYLILNIVPADNIIARNQIDKYMKGERDGLEYVFTLSEDVLPAMEYLYNNTSDEEIRKHIENFADEKKREIADIPERWQRFNISRWKMINTEF